ncbi:M56 family metallopeptidase [Sphingomonas sp. 2R-10]|uniref:M56 family metallopeptidase n=1 Tax=Sphingomonas sp. 2R-10 TaxID=3045148 RepID=UPI000F7A9BA4|nr:M56 family metallopeptidase [Sphingomonas sp. 2R-10]MDJ0275497.1 M56 family metallopeptidase [Sphingomonas sp. 2R-10]
MIGWAVETIAATTLLMVLVLMLRGPVARRFGPQAAYALWALPALRMILPPIPDAWRPVDIAPIGAATEPGVIMLGVPVAEVPALPQGWGMADVPLAVIGLWLLGAVGFVAWHIVRHNRFCAKVLASGRAKGIAGGHVRMIETRHAAGPLAFGVFHRYVAMPVDFRERYDEREQALALAHELGHHARGDLLANWFALVVLGCHWFNPVAWRAFRAFRADQEMACDAMVLARATPQVRHAYATAIVKSAHGQGLSAACHLHGVHELKGRLIMLSKHRVMSPATRRIAGGATLALAVIGLGITASGTEAAETLRGKVEDATGVEIASVEAKAAAALAPVAAIVPVQAATAAPLPAPAEPAPPPAIAAPARAVQPAAPAIAARPAVPAAPAAPAAPAQGAVRKIVVQKFDGDGKLLGQSVSDIPDVRVVSANCGPGDARQTSMTRMEGGKQVTVICSDRIRIVTRDAQFRAEQGAKLAAISAARAAQGEAQAAQGQVYARQGQRAALAGLRSARASIMANKDMPAIARTSALAGIDDSIREIQSEIDSED